MTDLPLVISHESTIPMYLQIKNQLWFLVLSRRLERGARLPSVRELADRLAINPGTVAKAYGELKSEGVIVARKGHGTFVEGAVRSDPHADAPLRERQLAEALDAALVRGLSLGFSHDEIQQRLVALLSGARSRGVAAFVGPTRAIADKYARLLGDAFPSLEVRALLIDALEGDPGPALDGVYYVATLATLGYEVRRALEARPRPYRVIGLVARIDPDTQRRLAALPPDARPCLIAERRNLHAALNFLSGFLGPDLPHALTEEPDRIAAACRDRDPVIHTLTAGAVLDAAGVPADRRFELRFEPEAESLAAFGRLFGLERRGGDRVHEPEH